MANLSYYTVKQFSNEVFSAEENAIESYLHINYGISRNYLDVLHDNFTNIKLKNVGLHKIMRVIDNIYVAEWIDNGDKVIELEFKFPFWKVIEHWRK